MSIFIGLLSGKGGAGKTSTALNLGAALNHFGRDVILVDGNLSTPNLGLHLGVHSVPISLHDVLRGKNNIAEAVYAHSSGVKLLPAGLSLNDMKNINPSNLNKFLPALDGLADIILVDSAAGLGREALSVMEAVDEILIVTNPELPAVTDALKTIKLADEIGKKVRGVIVTRHGGKGDMSLENISLLLGKPVVGVVPEDEAMRQSLVRRESVLHILPRSKSAIAYKNLAAFLTGIDYREDIKEGWFSRFLSRIGFRAN